jgi:hypothetical protein
MGITRIDPRNPHNPLNPRFVFTSRPT